MTMIETRLRITLATVLLVFTAVASSAEEEAAPGTPRVLCLNSYHDGLDWSDEVMNGVTETLGDNAEIHIEYMDTKRQLREDVLLRLRDLYAAKYDPGFFNVILSSDDNAFVFLKRFHEELFPGTPVVFCGVNHFTPEMIEGYPLFTGVAERIYIDKTIDLARQLQPDTREVLAVVGMTPSARTHKALLQNIAKGNPGLHFTFTDEIPDLTHTGLLELLKSTPSPTIVYWADFFRSPAGTFADTGEFLPIASQASPNPVYVGTTSYHVEGTLGGHLARGYLQGCAAAEMALQVLRGTPVSDIPPLMESPNQYIVDYRQMVRYGLSQARLPEGTLIRHKPDSFYHRNWRLVWGIGVFILLLLIVIAGLVVNIHHRRRVQAALLESRKNYQALSDYSLQGIAILQNDPARFVFVNPAMSELFGYTRDELLGFSGEAIWSIIHPDDREMVKTRFLERHAGDTTHPRYEFRAMTKSGDTRWMEIFASMMTFNGRPASQSVFVDITDRKLSEERLRESERNLDMTLNALGDALVSCDREGRVLRMNREAERLVKWSEGEAVGRPIQEIVSLEDETNRRPLPPPALYVIRESRKDCISLEAMLIDRERERIRITASCSPILGHDGVIEGAVFVFRDISESYHLQEQLRHAQKMDAVGQLAGGVAHDFNNMLGGIMGAGGLLLKHLPEGDERLQRYVRIILETSERAADLTQKLLTFSRKGTHRAIPVDLRDAVAEAADILSHTIDRHIELSCHAPKTPVPITGDPGQIQNAVLNLALNARDAMPGGGRITITIHVTHVGTDRAALLPFDIPSGNYAEVSVADTGLGIDESIREHIFEPFFTTKGVGKGTGLGLAAVYGVMKDHGGAVELETEISKGSTFRLLFPLRTGTDTRSASTRHKQPVTGSGTILFVDDEQSILDTASEMLRELGYTVDCAPDGKEALDMIRRSEVPYDLVILDVVMPRMDGLEAFRAIHQACPGARVLIASGFSIDNKARTMLDEGASGFVQKPYTASALSEAIQTALSES